MSCRVNDDRSAQSAKTLTTWLSFDKMVDSPHKLLVSSSLNIQRNFPRGVGVRGVRSGLKKTKYVPTLFLLKKLGQLSVQPSSQMLPIALVCGMFCLVCCLSSCNFFGGHRFTGAASGN